MIFWRCVHCGFDCKVSTEIICQDCGSTRKGFDKE